LEVKEKVLSHPGEKKSRGSFNKEKGGGKHRLGKKKKMSPVSGNGLKESGLKGSKAKGKGGEKLSTRGAGKPYHCCKGRDGERMPQAGANIPVFWKRAELCRKEGQRKKNH